MAKYEAEYVALIIFPKLSFCCVSIALIVVCNEYSLIFKVDRFIPESALKSKSISTF